MGLLKKYIAIIKNSSVYKDLLNNYFLLAFLLLLVLISYTNIICIIFLGYYLYYLYKKTKVIFYIGITFSIFISLNFLYLRCSYEYTYLEELSGKVIGIEDSNDGQKLTLQSFNRKYIVYDYNNYEIKYGDIINVQGKTLDNMGSRVKNGFDYSEYLKHNRIFCTMLAKNIEVVENRFTFNVIKHYFKKYLENYFSYKSTVFLKAMVVGELDDIDSDFREAIMNNGILHLFAVSGLHIVLFIGLLEKALKFFRIKENKIEIINSIFLLVYLVLTSFSASVLRASMMYYISLINKKQKLGLSTLDIISIIFIILITYNPLYYYNLGFNLSFISSTIIVVIGDLFKKYNKYLQVLIISIFANLVTFPLVININGKINMLSPISNVIFIELVEVIILPISFFILVFPLFSKLYDLLIIAFDKITLFFSRYFIINLKFPYFKNMFIIFYFLFLFSLIRVYYIKKLRTGFVVVFVLLLFIFSNSIYIFPKQEIHFLDLANGESSLLIDNRNECFALIDTGDGSNNEVTSYLKRQGIKKLNYLILTHNHLDHNGEANNILKEIKVNNLVISAYDSSVTNNFFNKENLSNIIKVRAGDELECGGIRFYVLHPDNYYNDDNDNSIVIYTKFGGLHFLFLGDVTKAVENKILSVNINVDVIKIAHHGSSTSTSAYLIEKLRPKYAVIMAGRVEKFAFPHSPTIEVLNKYNVKTYRTDIDYSIIYKYKKNKSIFETIK